jgi:hypothetical protein
MATAKKTTAARKTAAKKPAKPEPVISEATVEVVDEPEHATDEAVPPAATDIEEKWVAAEEKAADQAELIEAQAAEIARLRAMVPQPDPEPDKIEVYVEAPTGQCLEDSWCQTYEQGVFEGICRWCNHRADSHKRNPAGAVFVVNPDKDKAVVT